MLLRVDKPLTRRVQEAVLRLIRERNYQPGEKVPAEAELGELLGLDVQRLERPLVTLSSKGFFKNLTVEGLS